MKRSNTMKSTTRPGRPHKYSPEVKISIARRVLEEGKSQAELSRETKISTTNIYKWVQQARRGELGDYVVPAFDA
jgi:transposase-like protein